MPGRVPRPRGRIRDRKGREERKQGEGGRRKGENRQATLTQPLLYATHRDQSTFSQQIPVYKVPLFPFYRP